MAAALQPLELKITAPSVKAVDQITQDLKRNIQGLISDTARLSNAFRVVGSVGVQAFREIGAAKDALRRNIKFLEADLLRLNSLLRINLGSGLGSAISVRVIPIIDALALRVLPPIELPVIPVITQSLAALQPLVVPVIPVLPPITLQPLEVPVIPILEPLAALALEPIKVRVEPILESFTANIPPIKVKLEAEGKIAVPTLEPVKVVIEASELEFRNALQRVVAASQEAGVVSGNAFKRAFEDTSSRIKVSIGTGGGKTESFAAAREQLEPLRVATQKVSDEFKVFARDILLVAAALQDGDITAAEANKQFLELGLSSEAASKKIREIALSAESTLPALESVGQEGRISLGGLGPIGESLGRVLDRVRQGVVGVSRSLGDLRPGVVEFRTLAEAQAFAADASGILASAIQADVAAVTELTGAQAFLARAQSSGSPTTLANAEFRLAIAEEEATAAAEALTAAHKNADLAANSLAAAERKATVGLGEVAVAQETATATASKSFSEMERSATSSFNNIGGGFKRFVGQFLQQISLITTIGIGAFAGLALKSTADLETLHTALESLVGAGADAAFAQITTFAAQTPFQVGEVTKAVISLNSALGLTVPQALDFLKIIGNAGAVSGATADQVNAAVVAVTQMGAAGKLTAQDLNQITTALPAISRTKVYAQLAKDLNITEEAARSAAENGLIPSAEAIKAITEVAKQANPAQDALGKQAKTLTGLFSTLKDTFNLVAASALGPLVTGLENLLDPILNGAGSFEKLTGSAKSFGETLNNALKALGPDVRSIIDSIKSVFSDIVQVAPALALNLKGVVDVFAELLAIGAKIADALTPVVKAILAVTGAALQFGVARAIIEGLLARFLALKAIETITPIIKGLGNALVSIGDFAINVAKGIGNLVASLIESAFGANRFSIALREISAAEEATSLTTTTLASSLSGALATGIGIAVVAWQLYNSWITKVKDKQDELLKQATQGLVVGPSNPNAIKDQQAELDAAQKLADDAQKKRDKNRNSINGKLVNLFPNVDPAATLKQIANEKALNEALKNRDKVLQNIAVRQDILSNVGAQTGANTEKILAEATKQGLDIFHVDPVSEKTFIEKLVAGLKAGEAVGTEGGTAIGTAIGKSVNDAFGDTIKGIQDKAKDAFSAEDALLGAQENLLSARKSLAGVDKQIADLQKQQRDLSNDKKRITDEELDALNAVHNLERQITANLKDQAAAKLEFERANQDELLNEQLASAKIDLSNEDLIIAKQKLLEAQKALTDETKKTGVNEGGFVNIAGLSLDAARARLAAVRSTLAAQKAGAAADTASTKDGKTKDELIHDALAAKVTELEAEQSVTDAKRAQTDLLKTAQTRQEDYNAKVKELKETEADLRRDRAIAADDYQKTLNGEIGIKKQIKDIDKQLKDLADQRKDAENQVENAEKAVAKAVADSKGDYLGILQATQDIYNTRRNHLTTEGLITDELNKQGGIIGKSATDFTKLRSDLEAAAKLDLTNTVKAFIGPLSPDNIASIASAQDPRTIQRIIDEALKDPTSSLHDIMKRIFKELHLVVPGFAKGGYISQAATPFGQTVRVAEQGAEAILPLTSKSAMRRVLGDSRVLDPILAALPQLSLPTEGLNKSSAPSSQITEQQRRNQQREFAGYVADAIVAKSGDGGKDIVINQTFETGAYIDTNALARKAAKEADRAFRNRNI